MTRPATPRLGPVIPIPQDIRPIPDPTVLTTQQLVREIGTFREIIEARVAMVGGVITTRLEGMDKAIDLLQQQTDRTPDHIEGVVRQLKLLHEEKFDSIGTQFAERDTRTEQTSRDSKVAVDAALQAAKEAVGEQNKSNALAIAKSENAFTKQIDQIGVLVGTMGKAIDDKIDDIKGRIQTIEGQRKGASDIWALLIAGGGIVVAALAIVFARMH